MIEVVVENGRRYCNDTYFMPNDETEQTRLTIIHQIYLILFNGQNTKIPLPPDTSRILDIGSGTGDWAIAIAEEFPHAEVIATDIGVFDSNTIEMAPPNVYFQLDDAEQDWDYHGLFDFVHIRGLSGAIADWPALYRRTFAHLRPGGMLEVTDTDLASIRFRNGQPPSPDSYLCIYTAALHSAADVSGYPRGLNHMRNFVLSSAGFVDIRTEDVQVAVGLWRGSMTPLDINTNNTPPPHPNDDNTNENNFFNDNMRDDTLGKMALISLLEGLEPTCMRLLTKYLGWDPENVVDLCEKVKWELIEAEAVRGVLRVVVAKKPDR